MTAYSSLDRESFQTLLASAFAVQESGMNQQSLSAVIDIHNAIAKEELPFGKVLDLIADRARIVADATGIAIGLLTRDQLVYRAGSGSGAQHIGQRVTAVLSASGHTGPRKEILRVDNAKSDPRIEAAICRECDAKALLILPIYRDRFVAGVLEVLFRDVHSFSDEEMRAYRLMANLVEEAMARDLQRSQERKLTTQSTSTQASVDKAPFQIPGLPGDDQPTPNPSIVHVCSATATLPGTLPTQSPPAEEAATSKWLLTLASFRIAHWSLDATVVVILLGLAGWISLHQHVASIVKGASLTRANASGKYASRMIVNNSPNTPSGTHQTRTARPQFRRVRVGPNEVDYIADDVTIRHFTRPVPPSPAHSGYTQVNIGDDVTVRIFKDKLEVLPQNSLCQERRTP